MKKLKYCDIYSPYKFRAVITIDSKIVEFCHRAKAGDHGMVEVYVPLNEPDLVCPRYGCWVSGGHPLEKFYGKVEILEFETEEGWTNAKSLKLPIFDAVEAYKSRRPHLRKS